jgi:hypothetical protein
MFRWDRRAPPSSSIRRGTRQIIVHRILFSATCPIRSVFKALKPLAVGSHDAQISAEGKIGDRRNLVAVLDDHVDTAEALDLLLRSSGFDTVVFTRSREFLERFSALQPALVLLDLTMPECDGSRGRSGASHDARVGSSRARPVRACGLSVRCRARAMGRDGGTAEACRRRRAVRSCQSCSGFRRRRGTSFGGRGPAGGETSSSTMASAASASLEATLSP